MCWLLASYCNTVLLMLKKYSCVYMFQHIDGKKSLSIQKNTVLFVIFVCLHLYLNSCLFYFLHSFSCPKSHWIPALSRQRFIYIWFKICVWVCSWHFLIWHNFGYFKLSAEPSHNTNNTINKWVAWWALDHLHCFDGTQLNTLLIRGNVCKSGQSSCLRPILC